MVRAARVRAAGGGDHRDRRVDARPHVCHRQRRRRGRAAPSDLAAHAASTLPGTGPVAHVVHDAAERRPARRASQRRRSISSRSPIRIPRSAGTRCSARSGTRATPKPEYVWQSTGATDDFEPKISLVPLVFGTIKGTFYALLFAIPLAVLGALYTSQFVHPSIRARIKPTVEIMAALPSVVIGFVAGLYLAPVVERNLVGVMLLIVVLPVFGTSGFARLERPAGRAPAAPRGRRRAAGHPAAAAPRRLDRARRSRRRVESWLFGGDARQWLSTTLGITYDQRNSLVVGPGDGLRGHPDHLHDLRGRVLERAVDPVGGVARARREPLADGGARRHSDGEPRRLLRHHGRLRPRRRRDDDRADGDRQHAGASTGRSSTASARCRPTSPSRSPRRRRAGRCIARCSCRPRCSSS